MSRQALVVMAKQPAAGRTKTRLSPPLSAPEAAELYACFLRDTLDLVRSLPGVAPVIAYTPLQPAAQAYFQALAPDFHLVPQDGKTLGERLEMVLSHCLDRGYTRVAAMNSDSPLLPIEYLRQAFVLLKDAHIDVVLGPCDDGGYYLIGWKRLHPRLVREVEMSTSRVLSDTLALAAQEGLGVALLPPWYDIDTAADLRRLQDDLAALPENGRYTRRFLRERPAKSLL